MLRDSTFTIFNSSVFIFLSPHRFDATGLSVYDLQLVCLYFCFPLRFDASGLNVKVRCFGTQRLRSSTRLSLFLFARKGSMLRDSAFTIFNSSVFIFLSHHGSRLRDSGCLRSSTRLSLFFFRPKGLMLRDSAFTAVLSVPVWSRTSRT